MMLWIRLLLASAILVPLVACGAPAAAPTAAPAAKPAAQPAAPAAPTVAPAAPTAPAAAPVATKPAAPAKANTVTFGMVTPSPSYWPVLTGRAKGMFEKAGLNLELTLTDSSARLTQAVVGGSLNMGMATADAAILAIESGADIVIIGGVVNMPTYTLISQAKIKTVADLKGKTIGATALKSGETVMARKMLAASGLKDTDYNIIISGALAQRFAAMTNGSVDAVMMTEPQESMLLDQGFNRLGRSSDLIKDYQFLVHIAKKDWAKANEDVVVRYLKTVREATDWLYDAKNADDAVKILMDATKTEEKYSRKSYDTYAKDLKPWPKDLAPSEAGMKSMIDILGELGDLKAPLPDQKKYIDLSYVSKMGAR